MLYCVSNIAIQFCKGLYSLVVMDFMCKRQQSPTVILTNRLSAYLTKNNKQDCSVAKWRKSRTSCAKCSTTS